jgi:hypothetical protein
LCWMKMNRHRKFIYIYIYKHILISRLEFSHFSLFECICMYVRCLCVFKDEQK